MSKEPKDLQQRRLVTTPILISVAIIAVAIGFYVYLVSFNTAPDSSSPNIDQELEAENPPATDFSRSELIRIDLADRLTLTENERQKIEILTEEATTWPDGCLGLGSVDEVCTQAIVEGYRVVATYNFQDFVYRSDQSGTQLRLE